jgi:hypothetical protein
MTIDVDDVCTESQLDDFLGGQLTAGKNLRPKAWASCEPARQYALDRILNAMKRRTPPILEADLHDVTELRHAVELGASERLYMLAASSGGDSELFAFMAKKYGDQFEDEINGLSPTLTGGARGSTHSFSIARR